ncbi:hypothetical protein SAMN05421505_15219 [Sinosporangium album]|uniref:Uncharacterized protein n=1 Tax=Sinosporangium album TaxID=504805 RepID=A0A1G8KLU9_9ACTN|nr:hypothetical protein [Sinosporangium album]SDI44395.1 hypothetical protein SAMN05421505_15219 [Sinosporangium album]
MGRPGVDLQAKAIEAMAYGVSLISALFLAGFSYALSPYTYGHGVGGRLVDPDTVAALNLFTSTSIVMGGVMLLLKRNSKLNVVTSAVVVVFDLARIVYLNTLS